MTRIEVIERPDLPALGRRWRDLELRAAAPIFRSWTWTGCLAAERFPDPVAVEATEAGRTVALALFNRVRTGFGQPDLLYLGERGDPGYDCPYIEHNGVLAEAGREAELTRACLGAVARTHVLVLSGAGETTLRAARDAAALLCIRKCSDAPVLDLASVRRRGDFLASLSANTRQQIRRSDRAYAGLGPLAVRNAGSVAEAHAMLDRMAVLHQAAWTARGRPGSFANPFFGRFHHALIEAGFAFGHVALTEVLAGGRTIGILYNLRDADGLRAYQSGFDYTLLSDPRAKPGLTTHAAAIAQALTEGAGRYDFLAGDDRYKRSLADGAVRQYWLEAGPAWAPRLVRQQLRQWLRRSSPGPVSEAKSDNPAAAVLLSQPD